MSEQVDSETTGSASDDGLDLREGAQQLAGVATMWARHGISVGRMGLEASAKTLQQASALLGTLVDRLGAEQPAPRP